MRDSESRRQFLARRFTELLAEPQPDSIGDAIAWAVIRAISDECDAVCDTYPRGKCPCDTYPEPVELWFTPASA
jgi:hypothetical protein